MQIQLVGLACILTALSTSALPCQPRQLAADSLWRRVWVIGVDSTAETFSEPRGAIVSGDLVVALDMGNREIRGFDARTGAPRFVMTARGTGPGEFKRPAMVVRTPAGFAVLDHAAARLTGYDRRARPLWDVNIPDVFNVAGIGVPTDSRILVAYQRRDSSFVVLDTSGSRVAVRRIPWSIPRPTPISFAHSGYMDCEPLNYTCVLAPMFGSEWASYNQRQQIATARTFVEKFPEPVVTRTERVVEMSMKKAIVRASEGSESPHAARAVAIRGDTAIVNASDTREHKYRILDYYHVPSGRYVYSRVLPLAPTAFSVSEDGTFFATIITENEQALVAFRPERLPSTPAIAKPAATSSRPPGTRARPPRPASAPPPGNR